MKKKGVFIYFPSTKARVRLLAAAEQIDIFVGGSSMAILGNWFRIDTPLLQFD